MEGHSCKRGEEYAREVFIAPKRILTTTMRVKNGFLPLIPVRSDRPNSKERLRDTLIKIAQTVAEAPIKMGDILIENVLGIEINIIASRDLLPSSD
ncbi:MAG: DUF1667 domain-containing protein [Candidatus Odinarchaeota archaeon]